MSDQKAALETIRLICRLYSLLKRQKRLTQLLNFLSQLESKAKQLRASPDLKKNPSTDNSNPRYWKEVQETLHEVKTRYLSSPSDFSEYLEEVELRLSMVYNSSQVSKSNEFFPITHQIIKGGKITVLGLDRAGKTSILQRLKFGRWIPNTTPTVGMNAETIILDKVKFTVWDLGGQIQYRRALWKMYTKNSVGLIFVVDVSDPMRHPEVRTNIRRMLSLSHLDNLPLSIFVNKVDLIKGDLEVLEADLRNILGINNIQNRDIKVFRTSAKTGVGIKEGVYWLTDVILFRMGGIKDSDDESPSPTIHRSPGPKGPPSISI